MTSRFESEPAPVARRSGVSGDAVARWLMGVLGAGLIVFPMLTASGWALFAASPAIVLGVVLVVLCAFQPRINGPVRYRDLSIPIGPPRNEDQEEYE